MGRDRQTSGEAVWDFLGHTHSNGLMQTVCVQRGACWMPHFTPIRPRGQNRSMSQNSCTLPPSLSQHAPMTTSAQQSPSP